MSELLEKLASSLKQLVPHHFVSVEQSEFLKRYKENMDSSKAVILMDFSMNYTCVVQDASQSFHWAKKGVTVHPVVIYYKNEEGELRHENLCFISEDIKHDVSMVKIIQEKTVLFLKAKLTNVKDIMYMSDGCAGQYKNCYSFLHLCKHHEEYGLTASWAFFATSHGKSACDGLGGTVKREALKASLQRPYGDHILNADSLLQFCIQKLGATISFFQLLSTDINIERDRLKYMQKPCTIPGTRSYHHFIPVSGRSCIDCLGKHII